MILIGGGGHCRSCIDVIELTGNYEIVGILDQEKLIGEKLLSYKFIGTDDDIGKYVSEGCEFLVTIGQIKSPLARKSIYALLNKYAAKVATIISPRSYVSKYAEIGVGTIVMHDALVNANSSIGENCIINTKSLIEHDCRIGDNCHVSTAAIINGGSRIKDDCFVGSNATTREGVNIEENLFIKAGSVVK